VRISSDENSAFTVPSTRRATAPGFSSCGALLDASIPERIRARVAAFIQNPPTPALSDVPQLTGWKEHPRRRHARHRLADAREPPQVVERPVRGVARLGEDLAPADHEPDGDDELRRPRAVRLEPVVHPSVELEIPFGANQAIVCGSSGTIEMFSTR